MFEIYKKDITININGKDLTLSIRPLSGRFYGKFISVVKAFNGDINEKDFLEKLDEDTMNKLHELLLETLIKSYPTEDKELLSEFVTQNMFLLIPGFVEVNINSGNEKPK